MGESLPEELAERGHDLGPQLEPALLDACGGRIRDVHWFRSDWQRGGSATAYAEAERDGAWHDVVVKLPVGPAEYRATTGLDAGASPGPGVAFHGTELAGWDLAWVVMERLPGNPLAERLSKDVFRALVETAVRFSGGAERAWGLDPDRLAPDWDWEGLLDKARHAARDNPIDEGQHWNQTLRKVQRSLPALREEWAARPVNAWCHGDLHPGNLMERPEGSAWGEPGAVLLDFAEIHCGHWVEDAVYLERIYWAKPEMLCGAKPVSLMARARRDAGLDAGDEYQRLADIRRLMMAAVAPAFLHREEGHPLYLAAALKMIERTLPLVVR